MARPLLQGHTDGPVAACAAQRRMLAFLSNVGWRESMVLVIVGAVFIGLRLRKAIYKR